MATKIEELEAALAADPELAAKYKEALEGAEEAGAKSDAEALCLAAAAAGFELTPAEVERDMADAMQLSEEDLEAVAGGLVDPTLQEARNHDSDNVEDEFGHDGSCLVSWHCLTAMLHTSTASKEVSCWSDYHCVWLYNKN